MAACPATFAPSFPAARSSSPLLERKRRLLVEPFSSFRRYLERGVYLADWGAAEDVRALDFE